VAFGKGKIDFTDVIATMKPVISNLPWWCIDFCFNPQTPTAARDAVLVVRRLMEEALK